MKKIFSLLLVFAFLLTNNINVFGANNSIYNPIDSISAERISLTKNENDFTMFVVDSNNFVCYDKNKQEIKLSYFSDFNIQYILPYGNYIMIGSSEPQMVSETNILLNDNTTGLIWPGEYVGINLKTGNEFLINDPNEFYLLSISGIENDVLYSRPINGKTIPHPNYGFNDYYDLGYYTSPNGWGGGSQCQGFAFFIYDYIYGATGYKYTTARTYDEPEEAKSFLKNLSKGTMLRCSYGTGKHSMIFLDCDNDGIYIYHANWPTLDNNVTISYVTWEQFASNFSTVYFLISPHYVVTWNSYSSTQHRGLCSACNQYHYGTHYGETAGITTCMVCGYYGNMIGITNVQNVIY